MVKRCDSDCLGIAMTEEKEKGEILTCERRITTLLTSVISSASTSQCDCQTHLRWALQWSMGARNVEEEETYLLWRRLKKVICILTLVVAICNSLHFTPISTLMHLLRYFRREIFCSYWSILLMEKSVYNKSIDKINN